MNDSFFEETATAVSYREIRRRDPTFSLPDFVADIEEAIKPVLIAYSKGDTEMLKKYCNKEFIERCEGERQAYASHNLFFRNKFQTQQIHCVHNRDGQITHGGQDTIKTVYYNWAMQLMDSDELPKQNHTTQFGVYVRCNKLMSKLSYRLSQF
ncbi:hypothetical protein BRADI_1g60993v3 [Brachypodium distachyon]|uniref:Tim44-like domain-containing protein n=1 Tax=Brachypodium distachyon TaxID=15368 RepID=A0A2K2DSR0_BRADI|nr:hypothetical protein BRADI_1g60993v3 [Brachypodium distachyon]